MQAPSRAVEGGATSPSEGVWPRTVLHAVPESSAAVELAYDLRRRFDPVGERTGRFDLRRACDAGGFRLRENRLRGGLEAMLIPLDDDFRIVVDPAPRRGWQDVDPLLRADIARHRARFRVAHEIGHSFFYERQRPGIERLVGDSDEQEEFCDAFASALLVPPSAVTHRIPTAQHVVEAHERFDVSLEVAARAVARANPSVRVCLLIERPGGSLGVQWDADDNGAWAIAVATAHRRGAAAGSVSGPSLQHLPQRRQYAVVTAR